MKTFIKFTLLLTLLAAPAAFAATSTWSGGTSTDWNTAGNWSAGIPTAGNAIISSIPANICTITANPSVNPNDVIIGEGAGVSGQLNQTAGTLTMGATGANGNWFKAGTSTGTGTYNLADVTTTGGTLTGFGQGTGSIEIGKLFVGGGYYVPGGTGTVKINTTGYVHALSTQNFSGQGNSSIVVGFGAGNGTLLVDSGTINAGGIVDIACAQNNTQAATGTLSLGSGAIFNCEGDFRVAYAGSASAQGTVNLNGGTLNVASTTTRWLIVAQYDFAQATINVNSGNLNLNANTSIKYNTSSSSGTHTINLNGGAITAYSDNHVTANGTGALDLMTSSSTAVNTFNLNGGTLTIGSIIASSTAGTRVFNFNGGTLKPTVSSTTFFASGRVSAANVSTNGAIIDTAGKNITIAQALVHLDPATDGGLTKNGNGTLTLGGANTYNGNTTINAGQLSIGSSGSLATGNVTVSTATASAALGGAGTINGLATLNASSGGKNAAISLTNGVAETLTLAGGLTLNTGNVLNFDVATAGSDLLNVSGGTYNDSAVGAGGVTVNLTTIGASITTGGTIDLLTATSAPDVTKFTLATPAPVGYSWILQVSGNTLQVNITQTAPPVAYWNGGVSGNWSDADSGGLFNWATDSSGTTSTGQKPGGSTAVTFTTTTAGNLNTTLGGDFAVGSLEFNGAVAGTITIGGANILTNVGGLTLDGGAGAVTISASAYVVGADATIANNSSSDLTISSPVSGAHPLTFSGSGITKLAGNNSYTGPITVSAGTLVLSGNNTATTGVVTNSGTLQLQNAGAIAGSVLTLNANSTLQLRADANTTFTTASLGSLASGGTFNLDVNSLTSGTGQTLTLGGVIASSSTATETINVTGGNNYTLGLGAITQGNDTGLNLNVASGVNLTVASYSAGVLNGNNQTLTFSGAGNTTIGAITDTSPLANGGRDIYPVFNQSGTVTLTGTNNFFQGLNRTGNIFAINNGTLVIANSAALNVATLGASTAFTLGSTIGDPNNVNFLLGTAGSSGGLTTGTSANKINSFIVQDADGGTITIGGQNTSGVNTFSGNFTLGASGGKSVTLIAATGGEVDFTGNLLANGGDTTAGITVGDGTHAGTVKLTGLNTYLGGTTVSAGTLVLSSQTGTSSNGNLTVSDGGTLQITVSGTSQLTPPTLTVGSSTGGTLAFANVGSTSVAPLNPTAFTINGTATVNILSLSALNVGTYPLVGNYVSGATVLGTLPAHVNAHLSTSGGVLSLVVDSFAPDVWAAGTGVWNTNLFNWKVSGVTTNYNDGDVALFDDTATGSGPFTVTVTNIGVTPASVTVSNVTRNYTFAGGTIGGGGSLTKNGNGTLIIANTNTYALGTTISAGTLQLGDGAANNGAVAGTITDNSTLVFANPADQTFASVISGTGSVVKNAAGALTLGANNTYSGGTMLKAGSVILPNGATNSFGSGTLTLSNVTLIVRANSGNSYNSVNSDYIGNSVAVPAGTTNIIDNSANNFGNLWVGGDAGLWSGSGTVMFQNSGTVTAPAVLWNGNPLLSFNGTINIGATTSSFRMFNGIAYNSSAGNGTGTSVSTFDAHNVAWVLGDVGYSASQVQDPSCTTVQMGSISASNPNTTIRGNSSTPVTFEVGALNTSTTYAGTINDWNSAASAITHLTKVGSGTLTLSGANTYTGNTTINGGTLELAQSTPTLGTNSTVTIATGAHLKLTVGAVTNKVANLVTNGVPAGSGLYDSANSSGFITGSGYLQVGGPSGPDPITSSYDSNTGVLTLTWPSGVNWRLESQTNDLSTGLSPAGWSTVSDASDGSATITVDPAAPTVFYRLAYP